MARPRERNLQKDIEDLINEVSRNTEFPTVSSFANRHREEMDRVRAEMENMRRQTEQMLQENIMVTDSPLDEGALDLLNAMRSAQRRNEIVLGSEDPTQTKILNIKELHKMIQAICEYLEIQLIELPVKDLNGNDYRKYQAVRKGTKPEGKPIDRSNDLILEEDEEDGTKR